MSHMFTSTCPLKAQISPGLGHLTLSTPCPALGAPRTLRKARPGDAPGQGRRRRALPAGEGRLRGPPHAAPGGLFILRLSSYYHLFHFYYYYYYYYSCSIFIRSPTRRGFRRAGGLVRRPPDSERRRGLALMH